MCRPSDVDGLLLEDERVMLDCNGRQMLPEHGSMLPDKTDDAKGRASAAARKMCKCGPCNDAGNPRRRPRLACSLQRMRVLAIATACSKT